MKNVVIVESPTKAKTISKYLGGNFNVVASFGHVRDLESKKNSVETENGFRMHYAITQKSEKHLKDIISLIKGAEHIYLATDPDREGESISWHIIDELKIRKKITDKMQVHRVCFNEITKEAVKKAIDNPKDINMDLVDAQQARRALDYLMGFEISPILWRKLPGSKSAGRVQSVALRLICERESEIEIFKKEEYWTIDANFLTDKKEQFIANLFIYNDERVDKQQIQTESQANDIKSSLEKMQFSIFEILKKTIKRNPYAPFITSTLQQEASSKLGMSPKTTMSVAQKLYEGIDIKDSTVGLITYMRTDGIYLSESIVNNVRDFISKNYGQEYVPKSPRIYKNKVKNAQEAHEAIRPTDINMTPEYVKPYLDKMQFSLYEMIWKRTVACQMQEALFEQVSIIIKDTTQKNAFKTTGSIMKFDGFYRVYGAYDASDVDKLLPSVDESEKCFVDKLDAKQHFTQPPARYTESSIIKTLEEFGIGRPSTYAPILSILHERGYVSIEKKKLIPMMRGRIVVAFLTLFFGKYFEYNFTANMEKFLDEVSNGNKPWVDVLSEFWRDFYPTVQSVINQDKQYIIAEIENIMKYSIFNSINDQTNKDGSISNVACPKCKIGVLRLKFSKFGGFLGCDKYPECNFVKGLGMDSENGDLDNVEAVESKYPKKLGMLDRDEVSIRKGPYGLYIQKGENGKEKPKRVSVDSDNISLEQAVFLLSMPAIVCSIDGENVMLDRKKYGYYITYKNKNYSIRGIDPFDLNEETIKEVIKQNDEKKKK